MQHKYVYRTLNKFYMKAYVSIAAAIILGIIITAITKSFINLLLCGLIALFFLINVISVKAEYNAGNLIAIYGECYDFSEKRVAMNKTGMSGVYSFVVKQLNEKNQLTTEDMPPSIFIREQKRNFKRGANYCFIFRKNDKERYDETTLITYSMIFPNVIAENNTEAGE